MSKGIANMKDSWFSDNNFNGLPDEVFNDVTNFFDFPLEDVETDVEEDWDAQFKRLEEPCFDVFQVTSSGLCGKTEHNLRSFPTSCNGVPQIKQLAKTAGPTYGKTIPKPDVSFTGKHSHQFQTNSPVSVFESSSSSSAENSNVDLPTLSVKRTRSKRQRLSSSSPVFSISFNPTLHKYPKTTASESDTSLAGERISSCYQLKLGNKVEKQTEKDLSLLSDQVVIKTSSSKGPVATIKCMHCDVKKTPQWREGPMGPKTLCNACGVRYRSGRLYPEYRPAVSPTFVPSLHSNSHKKVVEMRSRDKPEAV
ncbi:PREDICTED: GATA transcription factor 11-like isoform X1 [Lupinus angustifolius]|nr:PREDICTED: GATA transcription factor 11-like isoform X1 [Lupinus angustifolius]